MTHFKNQIFANFETVFPEKGSNRIGQLSCSKMVVWVLWDTL